jgi:outer membrane lipoprotein-sorting protein
VKRLSLLATLAVALLVGAAAAAMTAEELIAKSIEATGGLEKIQGVKTIKTTGKFMMGGMEFPFTMYQKRPNLLRVEADIQGMQLIQAWNGESGWAINPMTGSKEPQDMSGMEAKGFKYQADMDGVLVGWKDKGYEVEYVGEDEVEGTPVHHLKLDTKDDMIFHMYFDAEYFLPIKQTAWIKMEEREVEQDTYMSDYKEVGGLVVAHAIESRVGGQVANQIMLETVEYDVPVEDAVFVKPAAASGE